MIPIGVGLLAFGYATAYYAINVLVWAHSGDPHVRPVPFKYCLGLAIDPKGPSVSQLWMPLFNLEAAPTNAPQYPMGGTGDPLATSPQNAPASNSAPPPAGSGGSISV